MRQFNITVNGVAYSVAVEEVNGAVAPVAVAPVVAATELAYKGALELMHYSTSEESQGNGGSDGFRSVIAAWEAAHPDIKLNQNVLANAEYKTQIATLAGANDLPDVFLLQGMNTIAWAEAGLVLDMSDIIKASPYYADYNTAFFAPFTTPDGKIYGLPALTGGTCTVVIYDKAMWKEAGVKVIPVVASVAMARMMERAGADAIVAEGTESGGHIGSATTMTLVPQVVDAVKIPVIAAGGIADGRGFAAAMMLGAEAVQMGTRFLVAKECVIHENYKQKVIAAKDIDSEVTGRSHGHPVRGLRNKMTREYLKKEAEGATFEELETLTLGGLRKAVVEGDTDMGSVLAGQIAGMVNKRQSCKEIVDEIMDEAEVLLKLK